MLSVHILFVNNLKARSHWLNFAGAFLERWKKSITARNRSLTLSKSWPLLKQRRIRSTTADVSRGALLPLRKFWVAQNIVSIEEGAIFYPRSTNAQSKFCMARRKFVNACVR